MANVESIRLPKFKINGKIGNIIKQGISTAIKAHPIGAQISGGIEMINKAKRIKTQIDQAAKKRK